MFLIGSASDVLLRRVSFLVSIREAFEIAEFRQARTGAGANQDSELRHFLLRNGAQFPAFLGER